MFSVFFFYEIYSELGKRIVGFNYIPSLFYNIKKAKPSAERSTPLKTTGRAMQRSEGASARKKRRLLDR